MSAEQTTHPKPWCILTALESFDRPLTVKDLAKINGVTPKTIYADVINGKLPVLNVGSGVIRFDPATLVAWFCERNPSLKRVRRDLYQEEAA